MKDRALKIGYGIHERQAARIDRTNIALPKLTLSGRWLERAGFEIGDRVRVSVEFGRLVIEKEGGQYHD